MISHTDCGDNEGKVRVKVPAISDCISAGWGDCGKAEPLSSSAMHLLAPSSPKHCSTSGILLAQKKGIRTPCQVTNEEGKCSVTAVKSICGNSLEERRLQTSNWSFLQCVVHVYIHLPPAFLLSLRILPGMGLQWAGGEMAARFTL